MSDTINNAWPKSIRLNMENRDLFIKTVVADLMPDEKRPSLYNFVREWGDRMYEDIYGPLKAEMDALPQWMFTKKDEFHVNLWAHEPKNSEWRNKEGQIEFQLSKERRMIVEKTSYHWNRSGNDVIAPVPEDHEVVQAYKDMKDADADWDANLRELNKTLHEVAYACNTSHQLFRAWPQALKYAQECFPYVEPAEAKRGGQTTISSDQLDLTAKLAQATAGAATQN